MDYTSFDFIRYSRSNVAPITIRQLIDERECRFVGKGLPRRGEHECPTRSSKNSSGFGAGPLRNRLDQRHLIRLFRPARLRRRAVSAFSRAAHASRCARSLSHDDHPAADSGIDRPCDRAGRHLGPPAAAQGAGRHRRVAGTSGGDHRRRKHAAAGRSPHEIRSRSGLVSAGSVRDDGRLPAGGTILAATSGPEDVSAAMDDGPLLLRGHASARTAHHSR